MTEDERFQAVYETILRRDTRYDGRYYVGIATTGIFCRPSCRSRTPKPENVRVYESMDEARQAGFRPCKRCKPDNPNPNGPDAELAQKVIDFIQSQYANPLTLNDIAEEMRISPFHLQRLFKRTTGTTPSKTLLRTRLEAAKQLLADTDRPIAEIAGEVGFRSISHFSAVFHKTYGCSPGEYRDQGGS